MLKKIVAIKNVGRFKNCNATGDVQFAKATLIYAPNGRGKTTFCDICRSLKTGVPDPILGRATLGAAAQPSRWSSTLPRVCSLRCTGSLETRTRPWGSALASLF